MRRAGGALRLEAQARAPRELASRITLTAQGERRRAGWREPRAHGVTFTGDWRVSASADDVDLASVGRLLPDSVGRAASRQRRRRGRARVAARTTRRRRREARARRRRAAGRARHRRLALRPDRARAATGGSATTPGTSSSTTSRSTREGRAWPVGVQRRRSISRSTATAGSSGSRCAALSAARGPHAVPLAAARIAAARRRGSRSRPHGDLRAVSVDVTRAGRRLDYTLAAQFSGLGFAPYNGLPGVTALTGEMRADTRSGRVDLRTGDSSFDWPQMFRAPLAIKSATGVVVWRQNQNEVRVVSDNLALATPDASARTNLELTLPLDGSSAAARSRKHDLELRDRRRAKVPAGSQDAAHRRRLARQRACRAGSRAAPRSRSSAP